MIIGLDFDNTIVCYDRAIKILAEQYLDLPKNLPRSKVAIRDYMRSKGAEDSWTRFQGELYGPGMTHAEPFENAFDVIRSLGSLGHRIFVISHRTRFPYVGERHDLHAFAAGWIDRRAHDLLTQVTFHESKASKIARIKNVGCSIFVDDLPEILLDPAFPTVTRGVLFSPSREPRDWSGDRISHWDDLTQLVSSLHGH